MNEGLTSMVTFRSAQLITGWMSPGSSPVGTAFPDGSNLYYQGSVDEELTSVVTLARPELPTECSCLTQLMLLRYYTVIR